MGDSFKLGEVYTYKKLINPKIAEKILSIGPPPFFHLNFFLYQNDSKLPKMYFKHNFENREIFYFCPPPPNNEFCHGF